MVDLSQLNFSHAAFTMSGATLTVLLRMSYKIGRFMKRYETVENRVAVHDKMLGLPPINGGSASDPLS